jgi:hypothetical protein
MTEIAKINELREKVQALLNAWTKENQGDKKLICTITIVHRPGKTTAGIFIEENNPALIPKMLIEEFFSKTRMQALGIYSATGARIRSIQGKKAWRNNGEPITINTVGDLLSCPCKSFYMAQIGEGVKATLKKVFESVGIEWK